MVVRCRSVAMIMQASVHPLTSDSLLAIRCQNRARLTQDKHDEKHSTIPTSRERLASNGIRGHEQTGQREGMQTTATTPAGLHSRRASLQKE
jgi:hypothetical protein